MTFRHRRVRRVRPAIVQRWVVPLTDEERLEEYRARWHRLLDAIHSRRPKLPKRMARYPCGRGVLTLDKVPLSRYSGLTNCGR